MRHTPWIVAFAAFLVSCSGLSSLTPAMFDEAEAKWKAAKPSSYTLVVAIDGDRKEREEFEVRVENGVPTALKLNGEVASSRSAKDYSMEGLFGIIREEMDLSRNPAMFGAPAGYSAYLMARFDTRTGGLVHYRRAVGGVSNSIDIQVLSFEAR